MNRFQDLVDKLPAEQQAAIDRRYEELHMQAKPNLTQNLKALKDHRAHLVHVIKVLTIDGKNPETYQARLKDTDQAIAEVEADL